jgi:hypothetical protein
VRDHPRLLVPMLELPTLVAKSDQAGSLAAE